MESSKRKQDESSEDIQNKKIKIDSVFDDTWGTESGSLESQDNKEIVIPIASLSFNIMKLISGYKL